LVGTNILLATHTCLDLSSNNPVQVDASTQMVQDNTVSLIPIHAELTTQTAADLLNISRLYLIEQIELGEIPHHKIGKHRLIHFNDLMVYKDQIDSVDSTRVRRNGGNGVAEFRYDSL
jgi:excisionase family DNA binding protein